VVQAPGLGKICGQRTGAIKVLKNHKILENLMKIDENQGI